MSWTAPASDGGSPITGYVVTPFIGLSRRRRTTFNSTATTQTVTGLTNGTTYTFKVAAINARHGPAVGVATPSPRAGTCPARPPSAPRPPATRGDRLVDGAGRNGGSAITGYVVTPYIGAVAQPSTTFNDTPRPRR